MWKNEAIYVFDIKNPGLGNFLRHMASYEGEDDEDGVLGESFNFNATHGTTIDDDASVAIWRVLCVTTVYARCAIANSVLFSHSSRPRATGLLLLQG